MLLCYLVDLPGYEEKISRLFSQQEYLVYVIETLGIIELISEKIQSAGKILAVSHPPILFKVKFWLKQLGRRKS